MLCFLSLIIDIYPDKTIKNDIPLTIKKKYLFSQLSLNIDN